MTYELKNKFLAYTLYGTLAVSSVLSGCSSQPYEIKAAKVEKATPYYIKNELGGSFERVKVQVDGVVVDFSKDKCTPLKKGDTINLVVQKPYFGNDLTGLQMRLIK